VARYSVAVLLAPTNGTLILTRLEHPLNAPSPMLVTLLGTTTVVIFKFSNALSPIVSIPSSSVSEVMFVHPLNALLPIVLMLPGIEILIRLVQLENVEADILTTGYPIYDDGILSDVPKVVYPVTLYVEDVLSNSKIKP
jgi:hypothetical protein